MKLIVFFVLALSSLPLYSQPVIGTKDITVGLDTPWEILWGPDGWIWMTERYGRISRVHPWTGEVRPLIVMPEVFETAECGLMGMALHPRFPDPPYLFCAYTGKTSDTTYGIHIVRYTYARDTLVDKQIINDPRRIEGGTIHEGCRIVIDSTDMTMYFTTGDAEKFFDNPQSDASYNGKVLRMNLDGSVPDDNPIHNSLVWSKGHRNAQGLTFGRNHTLYTTEHGTFEEDEVNIIRKKANYGWPYINGKEDFADEKKFAKDSNTTEPIFTWTPTIAPAGCAFYDHAEFPEFANSLIIAVLKGDGDGDSYTIVAQLDSTGRTVIDTTQYFYGQYGRFRDVCIAPDGKIFIATSNKDGKGSPHEGDDRIIMIYDTVTYKSVKADKAFLLQFTPNPMTGMRSRLSVPTELIGSRYEIVDALGRILRTGAIESGQHYIDRRGLSGGVYILRIGMNTIQFIVN